MTHQLSAGLALATLAQLVTAVLAKLLRFLPASSVSAAGQKITLLLLLLYLFDLDFSPKEDKKRIGRRVLSFQCRYMTIEDRMRTEIG